MIAGTAPDTWDAAPGYAWDDPEDQANLSVHRHGPTRDQVTRAITAVVGAAIADRLAVPRDDDGLVITALRETARKARNAAIRDAMSNVFPDMPPTLLDSCAIVTELAMDHKLTVDNWGSAMAKDLVAREIRSRDPAAADVVDIASFINDVMTAYNDR